MPTLTLKVSDELKGRVESLNFVNWSGAMSRYVTRQLSLAEQMKLFEEIVSKSKFTQKDADELSEKVKSSMHKRLKDEGLI